MDGWVGATRSLPGDLLPRALVGRAEGVKAESRLCQGGAVRVPAHSAFPFVQMSRPGLAPPHSTKPFSSLSPVRVRSCAQGLLP